MSKNNTEIAVLEYLRNLTPQILLFSIAMIFWMRLDFRTIDLNNIGVTFVFFFMTFVFVYALLANFMVFLEKICPSPCWISEKERKYKMRGIKRGRRIKYLVILILQREKN